jgi:transcriptional regulator with GAF, ATPase, and Fis domain
MDPETAFMQRRRDHTSAVWREVCRHIEIAEAAESVAALLAQHVPLAAFVVHRLEADHHRARIVATVPPASADDETGDVHLSESDWQKLERWLRRGEPVHCGATAAAMNRIVRLLGHSRPEGDCFVAPLVGEHGSRGAMTVLASSGKPFSAAHTAVIESVQEPMAVALDNDARLHEIDALREAAEADRRSLLRRLGRENVADKIVGEESGLRHVMDRVDMVSGSDVPVLILGETGTGKELVARAIHTRSDRHNGPFIRVNCGAIPRDLIDSQLFGHERGSFTGASETRQGWFERADLGTLFLDEIGELPLEAQVRLLRVLQDGFVERVGGSKLIRVNVRVVAATHRDLANMVRENSFREDLWYRIAVFPILLPPLRERPEDVPSLARHFAERAAVRFGLAPVMPGEHDIRLLQSYSWPGNIRELGTVIDRAAILGNGRTLELATALGLATPPKPAIVTSVTKAGETTRHPYREAVAPLDQAMRQHIESALRAAAGRIEGPQGAARALEINPHTLRARMRKLKIDWSHYREPREA